MLRRYIWFPLLLITILAVVTGCSRQPAVDTKPSPPVSVLGYMDMQKAVQAHPKYQELDQLQRQLNTLAFQIDQQQNMSAGTDNNGAGAAPAMGEPGLQAALNQEFQARMADKEAEVGRRMEASTAQSRQKAAEESKTYEEEVNRSFQPQIFNLQLKIRTLQLSKEELASLQQEVDKLEKERADRLSAKDQQLRSQMETAMAPAKAAADQEMAAFAQQLQQELAGRQNDQLAQMAKRSSATTTEVGPTDSESQLRQQAESKQQEIAALQADILRDIADKTAKVATEQQLDTVVTNILVNLSAVDITDKVIAEFKK